jgi:hypothetical protein
MDSIHLHGSEEVGRAAHAMREAAHEMMRAANYITESLQRHQAFLDDWLNRLHDEAPR